MDEAETALWQGVTSRLAGVTGESGQTLHLNNGQTLNDKLRDPKSVVAKWLADGLTDAQVVDALYLHALSRPPAAAEKAKFVAILADAGKLGPAARREAVEDFCWAVLTGREFLFNK